jgi:hypothetical protein
MRAYGRCDSCHRQLSVDLEDMACECGGTFKVVHPNATDASDKKSPLLGPGYILKRDGLKAHPEWVGEPQEPFEPSWNDEIVRREAAKIIEKLEERLQAETIMDELDRSRNE